MTEAQSPHQQLILSREIDYTQEQLDKHRRREDRLVEMRADGEIDRATYHAKVAEARGKIRRLEAELMELRSKAVSLDGTQPNRVVKAVQVLLAGRTRLTQDQKRAVNPRRSDGHKPARKPQGGEDLDQVHLLD